jgi:cleavage and polyadenylation specificity factor subunit 3
MLYTEQDLLNSMEKIEVIDYHQEREVNGIRFWCYNAGHVLGAAMFMIEIAGVRVCSSLRCGSLWFAVVRCGSL